MRTIVVAAVLVLSAFVVAPVGPAPVAAACEQGDLVCATGCPTGGQLFCLRVCASSAGCHSAIIE